jgi:xylan 1,4-beta-xylosidase
MRIVVKHPAAFQYAMKGKALLGKIGLPISGNDHHKADDIDLPDATEIIIDLAQSKGRYIQFWGGFGYNSFKAGSLDPMNQQLFQLMVEVNKKNPGTFNYIRAFNIFTNGAAVTQFGEGCEIYSEDEMGNSQFDWTVCDRVFDYIVSLGFDIVVDFTLMPIELASNKTRIQPWFGGNMSPPMSHEKWARLVYETTRHLTERYGLEQISRWYFEVWNEPDLAWLFWIADKDNPDSRLRDWGDMDAYNKLYDYTVDAVKRVHPNLQVGGPVVAGSYIEPFLEHLDEKNYLTGEKGTQVDFLSFHSYGSVFEKVINKIDEIHRTTGKIKKEHQKLPYIVSEFSPSPYDLPWYVTRYPAIWLIATVDAVFNYADQNQRPDFLPRMMIYWTSPVIKDFGENAVKKETDGLATALGNSLLKLPVFNAFEMLGYLTNERVAVHNNIPFPDYKENLGNELINLLSAIATRSDSTFEVLVYQFTENDAFSQNKKEYHVKLNIKNIPKQKFYLRKFAINENEGDSHSAWKRLNSPLVPDQYQLEILNQSDDLKPSIPAYEPEIVAGTYSEELTLKTNEAMIIVFSNKFDEVAPIHPSRILIKKIGTNSVYFEWQPSKIASDGDAATGYEVYQDQKLVARTFQNKFSSEDLFDNTTYQYQIYSLDEQGNKSEESLSFSIKTESDDTPPKLVDMNIQNLNTVDIKFNEPLDERTASEIHNYQLTSGVAITSVSLDQDGRTVKLKTTPHQRGEQYTLNIQMLRDRAQQPNEIQNYQIAYQFLLKYEDQFDFDNLNSYIWKHVWEEGGIGTYKYDANGKRLKVITGDDIGEGFAHSLPESDRGTFEVDFQPIKNYPTGGRFVLRLKQSDDTYYQFEKTHGYGPGYVKKVVKGFTVDSTSCGKEFQQGLKYRFNVSFAPEETMVTGFNGRVKIESNSHPIHVREFEIQLLQQDAYFDNIYYESR